jgi:hypothetical protein
MVSGCDTLGRGAFYKRHPGFMGIRSNKMREGLRSCSVLLLCALKIKTLLQRTNDIIPEFRSPCTVI